MRLACSCDFSKHSWQKGLNLHISYWFRSYSEFSGVDIDYGSGSTSTNSEAFVVAVALGSGIRLHFKLFSELGELLCLPRRCFLFWQFHLSISKPTSVRFCSARTDAAWGGIPYSGDSGFVLQYIHTLWRTDPWSAFMLIFLNMYLS